MSNGFDLEQVLRAYRFNLAYAEDLISDLTTEQMYTSYGNGLENNPAFTIGHLVTGSELMVEDLGGEYRVDESWSEMFLRRGPGDARLPDLDPKTGPSKEELMARFRESHARVESAALEFPPERWSEPVEWRFNRYFPTMADLLTFMCITHEAMHLGQVAAWRRAVGLPSSLARL